MRMEQGQRQEWSLVHPDAEAARLKLACVLTESEAPMQRIASDVERRGPTAWTIRPGQRGKMLASNASWNAEMDGVLSRVLVEKPAAGLKIPLVAFRQGHVLAARKTLSIGDHFGGRRRRTRFICIARDAH